MTERLSLHLDIGGFPSGSDSKESAGNAGDLISGSGRSSGEENSNHSIIFAWEIPWKEEPGGLHSPWGCKGSAMTERLIFWVL